MQGLLADIRKRNIADRVDKEVAEWASQLSTSSPLKYIGKETEDGIQKNVTAIKKDLDQIRRKAQPLHSENSEDAALGSLIGGFVAEAAGATLEMLGRLPNEEEVTRAMTMPGGGIHCLAPGQITDDGELTLAQAFVLIESENTPNITAFAKKYVEWLTSSPFDIGGTIFRALGCHNVYEWRDKVKQYGLGPIVTECAKKKNMNSPSNGCLMRAVPMAIWGRKLPIEELEALSFLETSLTHPHAHTVQCVFLYRLAVAHLMNYPGDYLGAFDKAWDWVETKGDPAVKQMLQDAKKNVNFPYFPEAGHVRIGFIHAFRHLLLQTDYYDAIHETLMGGGDTDTNGIIVGAMLGACYGVSCVPETMKNSVLGCRTNRRSDMNQPPRPHWMLAENAFYVARELLARAPEHIDVEVAKF